MVDIKNVEERAVDVGLDFLVDNLKFDEEGKLINVWNTTRVVDVEQLLNLNGLQEEAVKWSGLRKELFYTLNYVYTREGIDGVDKPVNLLFETMYSSYSEKLRVLKITGDNIEVESVISLKEKFDGIDDDGKRDLVHEKTKEAFESGKARDLLNTVHQLIVSELDNFLENENKLVKQG